MTDEELLAMGFKPSAELPNRWYKDLGDGSHCYLARGAGDYWSISVSGNGNGLKDNVAKFN
jgi:hypothetical protein